MVTDSKGERKLAKALDVSDEVVVYAKLPVGFFIPTTIGDYNPDWVISFKEVSVKHVYLVAETKGSMSSMELRGIEKTETEFAKKIFKKLRATVNTGRRPIDINIDNIITENCKRPIALGRKNLPLFMQ